MKNPRGQIDMTKSQIVEVKTHPLWGCVPEFRKDALGTLMKYAAYGDVVRVPYGLLVDLIKRPHDEGQVLTGCCPNQFSAYDARIMIT